MRASFTLSDDVLALLVKVERLLGRLEGLDVRRPQPQLRKRNRIRTVRGSAAIEGNTLSEAQVTAMLDGKRVIAPARELREVSNVNAAYDRVEGPAPFVATSKKSLLEAHRVLMSGLIPEAGRFRTSSVGVLRGNRVVHVAPPAHLVDTEIEALLRWLRRTTAPTLVAAAIAHYELLFIHPFSDGNGRLARLWHQVVHRPVSELLLSVPIESVIRERQAEYYRVLRTCDGVGDCSTFIRFSLEALAEALEAFVSEVRPALVRSEDRLDRAREHFGSSEFTRAQYLRLLPRLSTATASRDLASGVSKRLLRRVGEKALARYRFR